MKPHIRYSPTLRWWIVRHRPDGQPVTTVRQTWPEALAVIGIRCPEGWSR